MKTIAKNAIFKMIEAMNDHSIHNYKVEDILQSRDDDQKVSWSFSVFQITHEEKTGDVLFKELLSSPAEITVMAEAMLAGSYISVDTIGTKPDDYEVAKRSKWGKPHIRLY